MHHVDMLMCCLSASQAGLGMAGVFFHVFQEQFDLKNNNSNNSCSLGLQSSHLGSAVSRRGKLLLSSESQQCHFRQYNVKVVMLPVKAATSTAL